MKKYKLSYLPIALEDLGSIVDYICNVLQNPIAAENILNKIESAIIERLDMCESFPIWESTRNRLHPYRRINAGNYTIWYVVIDNVMEVRRIQPSNRNETSLLT
ncbi:MAG: type II toxin-antitoxin system RelE/ParE family toxin [Treponema sp.]|nr:type II toxin-antitoxin system RelE/ParE family toxin [Treponema sp.]